MNARTMQQGRRKPALLLAAMMPLLAACTTNPQRAAPSSLACMRTVRDAVPPELPAALKHCLAAGGIAMQCSAMESRLAGWGKELQDLVGGGDADRADLQANALGRQCAVSAKSAAELMECCKAAK